MSRRRPAHFRFARQRHFGSGAVRVYRTSCRLVGGRDFKDSVHCVVALVRHGRSISLEECVLAQCVPYILMADAYFSDAELSLNPLGHTHFRPTAAGVHGHFRLAGRLRQFAGWNLASSPETADWCVLFDAHATWVTLADDDPFAEIAPTWINGRCRDISKRTVERVFETVFGYPLAIDPLTHQGRCLRKSNQNCVKVNGVKDVRILACPIPVEELDEQYVYERLVDSRVPGLGIIELPTTVVGGEVISVFQGDHPGLDQHGSPRQRSSRCRGGLSGQRLLATGTGADCGLLRRHGPRLRETGHHPG